MPQPTINHFRRTLHIGMKGEDVFYMKDLLGDLAREYKFFPTLFIPRPDLNFDVLTSSLVKKFQEHVGLTPDGIFGKATYDAMERTYKNYIVDRVTPGFGVNARRY